MNKNVFIITGIVIFLFSCVLCCGVVIFLFVNTTNKTIVNPPMQACTLEARLCPDGTSVGRNPAKNCEFDECSQSAAACTDDAKICPDGSYVSRDPKNNCEFDACPIDSGKVCTQDIKVCPDGSNVSRDPNNNCEFQACI